MSLLLTILLWLVIFAVSIPSLVFMVEVVAALWPGPSLVWEHLPLRPRLAVLVPAHNEALLIADTLATILPQLHLSDRLVVVADNCTDETAIIARESGATVVERFNPDQPGKGYALAYGLLFLSADPPDVVIMIDADSRVSDGALDLLGRYAHGAGQPVQATYLMERPQDADLATAVSWFAYLVKNRVRPAGVLRLGWPCLLMGSGMAFPWAVLTQVDVASGKTAEDMRLAVDLTMAGYSPRFCADASVTSRLPRRRGAAQAQRARWEHGHLDTLFSQGPALLATAVRQRRSEPLALCLDLCVPPLSLLGLLWVGAWSGAILLGVLSQVWVAAWLLSLIALAMILTVTAIWARFARNQLPFSTLLYIPIYSLSKLPLYLAFLVNRQTASTRTHRD